MLDDAGLTARQIAARAWGTPIQVISRLVEHSSIAVTKLVHREARSTRQPSGAIATDWTSPVMGEPAELSPPTGQAS
ncbi:hypothetical protein [Amycolatopsis sp. cmx-8-4]|uniref:hypothetical protein n=1 Tax=Amycolatopsis sp. cmx-8-4 TaxID=2790947 RepID=UPI00397D32F2